VTRVSVRALCPNDPRTRGKRCSRLRASESLRLAGRGYSIATWAAAGHGGASPSDRPTPAGRRTPSGCHRWLGVAGRRNIDVPGDAAVGPPAARSGPGVLVAELRREAHMAGRLRARCWLRLRRHTWRACQCVRCGIRREAAHDAHEWDGCTCRACGLPRSHDLEEVSRGEVVERHSYGGEPAAVYQYTDYVTLRCKRCGVTTVQTVGGGFDGL
jgi:hypothetical protein